MVTKSLYAVAVFLIASVIVADAECEVGPVKDVHFEMDKFLGEWYWIYQEPNGVEKDVGCLKTTYQQFNAPTITMFQSSYNESTKAIQSAVCTVPHWNSTSYTQDRDSYGEIWASTFFLVALDYKNYAVLKSCLKGWDKHFRFLSHPLHNTCKMFSASTPGPGFCSTPPIINSTAKAAAHRIVFSE